MIFLSSVEVPECLYFFVMESELFLRILNIIKALIYKGYMPISEVHNKNKKNKKMNLSSFLFGNINENGELIEDDEENITNVIYLFIGLIIINFLTT